MRPPCLPQCYAVLTKFSSVKCKRYAKDLHFLIPQFDDKRVKTQTFSPTQAPFLDQRSLPKVHGLQPALVAQALCHLLFAVLIGLLNKLNYYYLIVL